MLHTMWPHSHSTWSVELLSRLVKGGHQFRLRFPTFFGAVPFGSTCAASQAAALETNWIRAFFVQRIQMANQLAVTLTLSLRFQCCPHIEYFHLVISYVTHLSLNNLIPKEKSAFLIREIDKRCQRVLIIIYFIINKQADLRLKLHWEFLWIVYYSFLSYVVMSGYGAAPF